MHTRWSDPVHGRVGKLLATRAPTRSGSNLSVRLCRSTRPLGRSCRGLALRLRTRSIARREARTIATCSKSAPPCALAPQTSAPAKQGGRTRPTMFCEAARPNADSRGTGKQGGRYTDRLCFPRTEAASPSSVYRCTQRYGRVAALGRAVGPTSGGLTFAVAQALLSLAPLHSPLPTVYLQV